MVQAYKNGERIGTEPLFERAFVFADGFFETMKVVGGQIPLIEFHVDRALATAEQLKIPLSKARINREIEIVLADLNTSGALSIDHSSFVFKLIVGRGAGGRGSYPDSVNEANTAIYSLVRAHSSSPRSSVQLISVTHRLPVKNRFAGLKLINRLEYSVATAGVNFSQNEEALLLDEAEYLVETMHHNLFLLKNSELHTPCLSGFGVNGVLRTLILKCVANNLKLNVREGRYSMSDLLQCDGAFITNSVEGVVSVSSVDGVDLPSSSLVESVVNEVNRFVQNF